jgi:hypothetical protein
MRCALRLTAKASLLRTEFEASHSVRNEEMVDHSITGRAA